MAEGHRIRDKFRKYYRPDIYRRLFPYFVPYWMHMGVVLAISSAQSCLALMLPWTLKVLIDNGLSGQPLPSWLVRWFPFTLRSSLSILIFAASAGVAIKLLDYLLDIGGSYLKARINGGVNLRFAVDLFNHLMRLSFRYHDQTTVGDSIYRVNNDTSFISSMAWNNFRYLLTSSISLVGMLWILIHLDWQLALLAILAAPLQYSMIGLYSKLFRAKAKRIKAMQSVGYAYIQQAFSCLRVVKAFGQEHREQRRLEDQNQAALQASVRLGVQQSLFSVGLRLMGKVDRGLILLLGGLHVLSGRLTIGGLLVILAYVDQLQDPVDAIGDVMQDMQNSMVSAERVFEVLDVEPDIQDRPGAKSLDHVEGAVTFENVTFGYERSHSILHGVNVNVRAGSVVAIVGPTGAGKTTFASLAMRFYDPDLGRVSLDGHDLRDISVQSLRDSVALVLQEAVLLSGTIHDNIAYGRPQATRDEVVAAAQAANAHDFIAALPDGYDTQ